MIAHIDQTFVDMVIELAAARFLTGEAAGEIGKPTE
jgi:hypothetical protein